MQTTNSQTQTYEEIDLVELVLKIYKFFKKRILLILLVTLVCVGIGVLGSFVVFQPRYQTSMIVLSRSMSASEFIGVTEAFNQLIKEKNWEEIHKLTGIPVELCENLRKIEAASNREVQKNVDKELIKDYTISLKIELTNLDSLEIVQKGILNYYENLPYVQKKKQIFLENKKRTLERVQKDIKHLDSLKKIIETSLASKQSLLISGVVSGNSDMTSQLLALYETENYLLEELSFPNDIKVIKELTRYQEPIKFSIKDNLLVSGSIGIILGICYGLIIELNKLIRQKEGNY